jgi:hypothetical protein
MKCKMTQIMKIHKNHQNHENHENHHFKTLKIDKIRTFIKPPWSFLCYFRFLTKPAEWPKTLKWVFFWPFFSSYFGHILWYPFLTTFKPSRLHLLNVHLDYARLFFRKRPNPYIDQNTPFFHQKWPYFDLF